VSVKAFSLILWSGGISYVRHSFHPRHAKTAYPGAPVLAEWRVEFSFLGYTISKNALAVRKISYPNVFEFHVALSAGMQLQGDLAIE
jgi:hypothetical protein